MLVATKTGVFHKKADHLHPCYLQKTAIFPRTADNLQAFFVASKIGCFLKEAGPSPAMFVATKQLFKKKKINVQKLYHEVFFIITRWFMRINQR